MPTNSLTNKSHELGQVTQTTSSSHISNHHPTHPNNTTVNFSPSPSNESIPNEKDRSLYISSDSTLDDKEVPDITSDDSEKSIEEGPKIGYFQLYRFATTWDWICVFLGSLCAVVQGVGQPMLSIFLGDFVSQLQPSIPLPQQIEVVRQIVIKFTAVGAAMFICGYGQMCFFTLSAENQTKRIRALYLHSILRQDMAWHDTGKRSQSLNSRLSSDSQLIFDGLADKVGQVIMNFSMVITGFAIAFAYGWKMTLVLFSAVPMMAVCAALMAKFATETSADGQDAYARAGAIAEQAISSIRTVVAFGGQSRELAKYSSELDNAYSSGAKKAWITGTGSGSFMLILFMSYSLAFWFGAHQVKGGHLSSGAVPTVLFATVIAAFSIGNIGPHVVVFARARAAAHIIFKTIDRVPEIDAFDPSGIKPEKFNGHIVVKDVNFTYPSRPNIPILQNMNIEVKPGQTVALV
ncbi:ATP-binding cassette, sub-B (MDR TAP), member 4, partial [Lunasporangiospora selenospora]